MTSKPTYPENFVSPRFSATCCCKYTDYTILEIFNKKKREILGVDPLGYKKRGDRDHPTPVGDAPAPDILCISLPVNSAVVPLINKGSVGQYREIETNIGRVNNSDVKLSPASRRWAQNRPQQCFCWA